MHFEYTDPIKVQILRLLRAQVKCHQIFHVIFETANQFSLNFASPFSVIRHNSSVLFWLKLFINFQNKILIYFQQKDPIEVQISWIFTRAVKIWNLNFDELFLSKEHDLWAKKVRKGYISWHWRLMQNLKKNWLVIWKMVWGIWWIFARPLESLKISILMSYFCWKYMFELRKNRGFMCHDTEEWCEI